MDEWWQWSARSAKGWQGCSAFRRGAAVSGRGRWSADGGLSRSEIRGPKGPSMLVYVPGCVPALGDTGIAVHPQDDRYKACVHRCVQGPEIRPDTAKYGRNWPPP